MNAPATIILAPPGKFLSFPPSLRSANFQTNIARTNCARRKEIPASAMVSDNCSSIWWPWVEISSGITYMWVTIGYADANAIITRTIANSLPMTPRSRSQFIRTRFFVSPAISILRKSRPVVAKKAQ